MDQLVRLVRYGKIGLEEISHAITFPIILPGRIACCNADRKSLVVTTITANYFVQLCDSVSGSVFNFM